MTGLPSGTVTFLFSDIEGSTRLWEELPDAMRDAVVGGDRAAHDLVVAREGVAHGVGVLLPQAGGPLDVGEEERDRPRRQVGHTEVHCRI